MSEKLRHNCGICNGDNHSTGECWPWQPEDERQRRFRLPYWQERMRANGLDPKKFLKSIVAPLVKKESSNEGNV